MKTYTPEQAKEIRTFCEEKLRRASPILCPMAKMSGACYVGSDCQPFFDAELTDCPCKMSLRGSLDMSREEIIEWFWKRLREMEK